MKLGDILQTLFYLLALLAAGAAMATDAEPGTPFVVSYNLYNRGAKVATMHRAMNQRPDGSFSYRSETKTTGLFSLVRKDQIIEESIWNLADGRLQPLFYTYDHSGGRKDRRVAVLFDWDEMRITNTVNGESWRMPTHPEVMDKLLYQFAIMFDLQAGRTDLQYTVADGGKVKVYEFEQVGNEEVDTPLGKFQSLKFIRHKQGTDRATILWCAPQLQFLPVKVENGEKDGSRTVAIVDSVTGLD